MKLIGLGNALVDFIFELKDDKALQDLALPKGSMQLINSDMLQVVSDYTADFGHKTAAGGSAANTISGLAHLGAKTAFIGKTGKDKQGKIYGENLLLEGIESKLMSCDLPSGRAMTFISPDGERTFATFLGAAATLAPEDLTKEMFEGYDIFHIEGYLVQSYPLIEQAIVLAKAAGCIVSIDMASYNVVEANLDFLHKLVNDSVDIVFANEEEAKAFTGKEAEEALDIIASMARIAVVKVGAKGALAKCGDEKIHVSALPAQCNDTNGAGDAFAAGFLFGISRACNLELSAKLGTLIASNVIEVVGTRLNDERWEKVNQDVLLLLQQHTETKYF